MSKKKKTESFTVEFDKSAAVRSISRDMFGHNPTRVIPDKTKYSRKQKHRKDFHNDNHHSGVLYLNIKILRRNFAEPKYVKDSSKPKIIVA